MPDLPASAVIHRILPATTTTPAWALHDARASRLIEQAASTRLLPHTLMRRAGQAVAQLAQAVAPHAQRIWIAAGPGNNGGDGLEAAIHLQATGKSVHVTLLAEPDKLPPDAADACRRAVAAGIPCTRDWPSFELGPHDLAIDALLGLGVSRAPDGPLAEAVERLNAGVACVLAVDLPSGLDADRGWLDDQASPRRCVRAHHTLSLLTLKPGLFTAHGRDQAGEVWFCDLDAATSQPASARLIACAPAAERRHAQHKGSFGSVAVIGGGPGMSGAAVLAGRAALHAGAGRVYVQLLDRASAPGLDTGAPELMLRPTIDWHDPATADYTAVAGCGGGQAMRDALPLLLSRASRLVLDADALNALAADPALQTLLIQRAAKKRPTILTPHPLEAARLLGVGATDIQAHRLSHAHELAQRLQSIVVLKGSGTIVQAPQGVPWINPTGNAGLASAGTGDVLAGWIGALWAQGQSAESAACQAVFMHGWRADQWVCAHPDRHLRASTLAAWA